MLVFSEGFSLNVPLKRYSNFYSALMLFCFFDSFLVWTVESSFRRRCWSEDLRLSVSQQIVRRGQMMKNRVGVVGSGDVTSGVYH